MFGVGGPELVVVVVLALIFVGPDKLPKVAKTVGAGLRDLRRAANIARSELKETLDDLAQEVDLKETLDDITAMVNEEGAPPDPRPSTSAQIDDVHEAVAANEPAEVASPTAPEPDAEGASSDPAQKRRPRDFTELLLAEAAAARQGVESLDLPGVRLTEADHSAAARLSDPQDGAARVSPDLVKSEEAGVRVEADAASTAVEPAAVSGTRARAGSPRRAGSPAAEEDAMAEVARGHEAEQEPHS